MAGAAALRKRFDDVDRAKGLAIFLVVLGHIVAGDLPAGNDWFGTVVHVIYLFHMPFFMYLSGFVMFYSFRPPQSTTQYLEYVGRKFFRIAPAFVLFGCIILTGKILADTYLHVDNMPQGWLPGIIDILIIPGESAAKGLWFVYVLFELYVIFPVLLLLARNEPLWLIPVGFLVHLLPATSYLALDSLLEYVLYFAVGCAVASRHEQLLSLFDRLLPVALPCFIAAFFLGSVGLEYEQTKLITGCLSIPVVHALVRRAPMSEWGVLATWGTLSFSIYLMNTIAIGFTKGLILQFSGWDGLHFLWVAPLLLGAGLFLPIFAKRVIFPWIPPLDRITN